MEADLEDELFLAELDRIEQVIHQRAFAIFSSVWIQDRSECTNAWVQKVCVRAPMYACMRQPKMANQLVTARNLPQSIQSHAGPAKALPSNEAAAPLPAHPAAPPATSFTARCIDHVAIEDVDHVEAALQHAALPRQTWHHRDDATGSRASAPKPVCLGSELVREGEREGGREGLGVERDTSGLKQNVVEEVDAKKFRQFTVTGVEHVAATSRTERAFAVLKLQHAPFHTQHMPQPTSHSGCSGGDEGQGGKGERADGGGETGCGSEWAGKGREGGACEAGVVVLHDSWAVDHVVVEGDSLVLVNCYEVEADGAWHLREGGPGLMVVHPHVLISASRLGDMLSCPRKAVLQEMVKDGDMGKSAIIGNLVHAVFQEILCGDDWSEPAILSAIARAVTSNLAELVGVSLSSEDAVQELRGYVKNTIEFFEMHRCSSVANDNEAAGDACGKNSKVGGLLNFLGSREQYRLKVVGPARDIEEMVCSTRYGLQGRIDATVRVELHPTTQKPGGDDFCFVCVCVCVRARARAREREREK